jgi:hypothetical protein
MATKQSQPKSDEHPGVACAFEHLQPGAFISILCYPGHAEGLAETAGVISWIEPCACAAQTLRSTKEPSKVTRQTQPHHIVVEKSA